MKSIIPDGATETPVDTSCQEYKKFKRAYAVYIVAMREYKALKATLNTLKYKIKLNTSGLNHLMGLHRKLIAARKLYYASRARMSRAAIELFKDQCVQKQKFYMTKRQIKKLSDKLGNFVEQNKEFPDTKVMCVSIRCDHEGRVI
jgi:hypothetical protein